MKFKLLVLTDHSSQSKENSIFALLQAMHTHPLCDRIDVASRGLESNREFFAGLDPAQLHARPVTADFAYDHQGKYFTEGLQPANLSDYDAIFLRLPPPLNRDFLDFLTTQFPDKKIINRPSGLRKTATKAFLLNFPEICPEMMLCENVTDIERFSQKFPIVLKPLRNYAGKGIVKIQDGQAEVDGILYTLPDFLRAHRKNPVPYLGMKFLRHVDQGDKRIVVVNREILGGVIRLPPAGAWLCNAAQGGRAVGSELSPEEQEMANRIIPVLYRNGIVMFGFDTLVNDNGKRILSEINTLSIGGLPQMEALNRQPVVSRAAELLWQYINDKLYGDPNRFHAL